MAGCTRVSKTEPPESRESGKAVPAGPSPEKPVRPEPAAVAAGPPEPAVRPAAEEIRVPAGPAPDHDPCDVWRGPASQPWVCLTLDSSLPSPDLPAILDILQRNRVRATFFLSGEFLEACPDDVRRIVRAGHPVGNHLFRHVHLTAWEQEKHQFTRPEVNKEYLRRLLDGNGRLFQRLTGRPMIRCWRAPFGETNRTINGWARELGYVHIGWTREPDGRRSLDGLDWVADPAEPRYLTAAQIRDRLLGFDEGRPGDANGGIVLLHAGSSRRTEKMVTVLEEIIRGMQSKQYQWVTVTDMLDMMAGAGLLPSWRPGAGDHWLAGSQPPGDAY